MSALPVTRQQAMGVLQQRLDQARLASDWDAMQAADRDLAALLQAWGRGPALQAAEQAALARLQASHRAAFEHCARSAEQIAVQLSDMNNRKDGWMAYAATTPWEDLSV